MKERWERSCAESKKRRQSETPPATQEASRPAPAPALTSPMPLLKRRRTSAPTVAAHVSESAPQPSTQHAAASTPNPLEARSTRGNAAGYSALVDFRPKLAWPSRRSKKHPKELHQPKAPSAPPARPQATVAEYLRDIHFERQREAQCGLHALNNIIGPILTDDDMEFALINFLEESAETGFETRDLHTRPGGWFSIEVLSNVLRTAFMAKFDRIVYAVSLWVARDHPDDIYAENCAGALVNVGGAHWTCVRYALGRLWYVDSLQEGPRPLTHPAWLRLLGKHPGTYYIQRL